MRVFQNKLQALNRVDITALALFFIALLLPACASSPPKNIDNICHIFESKRSWYKSAISAQKKWGVPVYVSMAFIHQESRFISKAKPPRSKVFWVFPGPRPSNAYGYAQALTGTWNDYERESGGRFANRTNFADAIDFIGWYNHKSHKTNRIKKNDAYNLYLAYHEGHGGFRRQTFKKKPWLIAVSKKVQHRASHYQKQYWQCHKKLEKRFFGGLFR